jgi:hypothetical protein
MNRKGHESVKKSIKVVIVGGAAMLGITVAAPASASHDHDIVTPGTCVEDVARGQTAKDAGEGGYHKFHENVHLGTPGSKAFDNANNPVEVYKAEADGSMPGC